MNKLSTILNRHSSLTLTTSALLGLAILFNSPSLIHAQDSSSSGETLSTEGIVGDVDKGRRAPVLTFSTSVAADGSSATILLDTQVINEDFKKYPISVDFFVNGKLFSKQFRSLELPAPLGITVPKEMAAVPFNYSIVATLLHPNRQYVTVAQGAISNSNSSSSLECTATETLSGDIAGVEILGSTPNTLDAQGSLVFTLTQDSNSAQATLNITASNASTSAQSSGSVVIQRADGTSSTYDVSGTAVVSGTVISSIDSTSSNGELTLKCITSPSVAASTLSTDSATTDSSDEENSDLAGVLNASPSESGTDSSNLSNNPNFIPLDEVDGVEVVN